MNVHVQNLRSPYLKVTVFFGRVQTCLNCWQLMGQLDIIKMPLFIKIKWSCFVLRATSWCFLDCCIFFFFHDCKRIKIVHIGVDHFPESNFTYTCFHRSEINFRLHKFIERNCKSSQQLRLKNQKWHFQVIFSHKKPLFGPLESLLGVNWQ